MNFILTVGLFTLFFTTIPFVAGLVTYRKLRPEFKILAMLFVVIFLVEAYSLYRLYYSQNNIWIYHFYFPVEYTALMYVFSVWQINSVVKKLIRLSIPVLIVISIIYTIQSPSLYVYNHLPMTIALPLYLLISTYTLLNRYSQDKGNILKNPVFWVCAAVILFSSCSLIHFVSLNMFAESKWIIIWAIHSVTNMVTNLLYTVGFIVHYRFGSVDEEPENHLMFR